jgi:hypothetical protein
MYSKLGEEEVK